MEDAVNTSANTPFQAETDEYNVPRNTSCSSCYEHVLFRRKIIRSPTLANMKSVIYIILNIFFNIIEMCNGQYTMMRPPKSNSCDNPRSTVLVEQFFNLIFSEFQNPPPVCVCVQMCIEQAAYCYPNGCLKRLDKRTEGSTIKPVNRIQYGTTQSLMFVVDKDPDFDDIFEVTSLKASSDIGHVNQLNEIIFNSNPFNELVLKYKRLPKMEMRYNLRERVKNFKTAKIKRDKLDMLKTKWPMNKHFGRKQLLNNLVQKNDQIRRTNVIVSTKPEVDYVIDSPKAYNRLKTKREDTVNTEELYLYQANNTIFSLETLIDTLILSSLHKNSENTTSRTIDETTLLENIHNTKSIQNDTNITRTITTIQDYVINYDSALNIASQNDYGALITTLSKEIDKQNDEGLKIAKKFITIRNQDFSVHSPKIKETTDCRLTSQNNKNISPTEANIKKSTLKNHIYLQSMKNVYPVLRDTLKKSSKKRIVRKLF